MIMSLVPGAFVHWVFSPVYDCWPGMSWIALCWDGKYLPVLGFSLSLLVRVMGLQVSQSGHK